MANIIVYCFLAVICLDGVTSAIIKDLPSYFPRCYRNDPGFNDCVLKATDAVRPYLIKGVPELNYPPLTPFKISEINLEQGTDAVNYKAYFTNVTILGMENYKFTALQFDLDKKHMHCEVYMPWIYMSGVYNIQGKILVAPIEGRGPFHGNITNSNGVLDVYYNEVVKNNEIYFAVKNDTTILNPGDIVEYEFKGIFDDNKVLAKAVLDVIDENREELINEIKPAIQEFMTRLFNDIVFVPLTKIPLNKLYPLK